MKNKVLEHIKLVRNCLYDSLFNERERPVDLLERANISDSNASLLKFIIDTLVASDNISEETRLCILNSDKNLKEVNSDLSNYMNKQINYSTTLARVSNDSKRLRGILIFFLCLP